MKYSYFPFILSNLFFSLLSFFILQIKYKSPNIFIDNIHKNEDVSNFSSTLDTLIYTMESDKESDDKDARGISSKMLRLEEEDKILSPHQKLVEVINLGSQEESKEVKIGTSITSETRKK